jgi:hypothetical protein
MLGSGRGGRRGGSLLCRLWGVSWDAEMEGEGGEEVPPMIIKSCVCGIIQGDLSCVCEC